MIIDSSNYNIECFKNLSDINEDRMSHLSHAVKFTTLKGYVCEFGVWKAYTTNLIAKHFHDQQVHGFDSFEGLPEKWFLTKQEKATGRAKHNTSTFAMNSLPTVESNVVLHKGYFEQTLSKWIDQQPKDFIISFLHIDSDLYSSCKYVLKHLNNHIIKDTIIVFDEFYRWDDPNIYELWEEGEYKALKEWLQENARSIEPLSRSKHGWQTAIRVAR